MTRDGVLAKLQGIFDNVFVEPVSVREDLTAASVSEWDSITHISLIVAIEKSFKIRFRIGEVESAQNVGALIDIIVEHLAS